MLTLSENKRARWHLCVIETDVCVQYEGCETRLLIRSVDGELVIGWDGMSNFAEVFENQRWVLGKGADVASCQYDALDVY